MEEFADELYKISQLIIRIDISCKKGILTYKLCYHNNDVYLIVMFSGKYVSCQKISLEQLSEICKKKWSLYDVTYIDKGTKGLFLNAKEKEKRRRKKNGR